MSTEPDTEIIVANTPLIEERPVVSGTRVVYERRATEGGPGDIVMFRREHAERDRDRVDGGG